VAGVVRGRIIGLTAAAGQKSMARFLAQIVARQRMQRVPRFTTIVEEIHYNGQSSMGVRATAAN
jgi:hypothetical protein